MTRERKLAIEQMTEVRKAIENDVNKHPASIMFEFCKKHGLVWSFDMWFCQYIGCRKCPITHPLHCEDNEYAVLTCGHATKAEKLDACDKIIQALQGKYKSEFINDQRV